MLTDQDFQKKIDVKRTARDTNLASIKKNLNKHLLKISIVLGFILFINLLLIFLKIPFELNDWSNLGQSLGLYASLISAASMVFIIYSLHAQNEQYERSKCESEIANLESERMQLRKIEILENQYAISTKLTALQAFINSQHELINYEENKLNSIRDGDTEDRLVDELNSSIQKRKAYVKNCLSDISRCINISASENNQEESTSIDEKVKVIEAIRNEIAKKESIPECAVITDDQIKIICDGVKDEKTICSILNNFKCYYIKWISKALFCKYDHIIEDINLFYKNDRGEVQTVLLNWANQMHFYNGLKDLRKEYAIKMDYPISHVLHYTQLNQLAVQQPKTTDQINCLSEIQKNDLNKAILDCISETNLMLNRSQFNIDVALADGSLWQKVNAKSDYWAKLDRLAFRQKCWEKEAYDKLLAIDQLIIKTKVPFTSGSKTYKIHLHHNTDKTYTVFLEI